ncbi:MAG TPA: helix-turn-helix transcriptional regulator [Thermoanaerobaculia bacterium]|nr:helix-turn-helix transcriptional regulator [Thermoanaerobaculia bacterium]
MAQKSPELLGFVLSILRQMAGWTQGRLEREAGLSQGAVSRLEHGVGLAPGLFDELVAILGQSAPWAPGLVNHLESYFAPEASIGSPADLSFQDRLLLEQLGRDAAATTERAAGRKFRKRLWRTERAAATAVWQRLRKVPEGIRPSLVEAVPAFHTWAVVERLCDESAKAASHDVDDAARFAALARIAAVHTPGAVGYQTWLSGYAASFEGNVIRVAGDLLRSRQVFVDAESQLQAGIPVEPMDRSRPIQLYGRLLTFRGELDAALLKMGQALALARTAHQVTRILVDRAAILKRKFQFREALDVLAKARLSSEGISDRRLSLVIAFNEVSYLWEASETEEAASRLVGLRADVHQLGGALDEVRFRWLTARVASSQGRRVEASSLLNEVWGSLADRRIWFDAALAVLELAEVELERGMAREVKGLATASAYVFSAQGLPTELLASIQLFWQAARQEAASAEDARELARQMRRSGGGDAEAA